MAYRPFTPFNVPLILLIPTVSTAYGVATKTYPTLAKGLPIFGSLRSFGGTDVTENGVYSVEDTATIETWYRPDITSDCRIAVAETGAVYEILGSPEDIEMRHQYLQVKLRRLKGGA